MRTDSSSSPSRQQAQSRDERLARMYRDLTNETDDAMEPCVRFDEALQEEFRSLAKRLRS